MKFTISQLTCGLAFALLLNPNATAQSGGSFAPPIQSRSFSGNTIGSAQNSGTAARFKVQNSNSRAFQPAAAQPTYGMSSAPISVGAAQSKTGASNFNPTPFKVTGSKTTSPPISSKTHQGKMRTASTGSSTRSGTQLPGHPSKPYSTQQSLKKNQLAAPKVKLPGDSFSTNSYSSKNSFSQGSPSTLRTAKPTSFGSPSSFPAQGRPSFGASPTRPRQITSNESSGGSSPLPQSIDCPISSVHFIEDIQLPAKEAGEIQTMNFKEGDFVPAGQTIAQINDENYQLLLEQANMRYQIALDTAGDKTASMAAEKKYQVASIEAKKTKRLAQSGSKSESDKMMATYTKEIAYLELRKAKQDRSKAMAEAKLAAAETHQVRTKIARHTLRCDFDAYVVEIKKHQQEYVQIGEEVMRLARMDRVWVQSVVDTKELNAHELMNRKVTVTIELARGETAEFEGVVKFVGLERQGPELLMVKAEVTNRPVNGHWVLHPEAEVAMEIHLNQDSSGSSNSFGTAATPKVNR